MVYLGGALNNLQLNLSFKTICAIAYDSYEKLKTERSKASKNESEFNSNT